MENFSSINELSLSDIKNLEQNKKIINTAISYIEKAMLELLSCDNEGDCGSERKSQIISSLELFIGKRGTISASLNQMTNLLIKTINAEQKIYQQNPQLLNYGHDSEDEDSDKINNEREVTEKYIGRIIKNINFRLGIKDGSDSAINEWIEEWMEEWINEGFKEKIEQSKLKGVDWTMLKSGPSRIKVKGVMSGKNCVEGDCSGVREGSDEERIVSLAKEHPIDFEVLRR